MSLLSLTTEQTRPAWDLKQLDAKKLDLAFTIYLYGGDQKAKCSHAEEATLVAQRLLQALQ